MDNTGMKLEQQKTGALKCLNALDLKLIAMALMLSDHIWYVFLQEQESFHWMTYIGRLAFPIFAFQIVEGFAYTHDLKKYISRVFLFALVSEIPFNLAFYGSISYPYHQNVMFTFGIALLLLAVIEKARKKGRTVFVLTSAVCIVVGYVAGYVTQVDYDGEGILTVMLLYFFRNMRFGWVGQLASLLFVNLGLFGFYNPSSVQWFTVALQTFNESQSQWVPLSGYTFPLPFIGPDVVWELTEQALAALALIPIWMYNRKQGPHSRALQYACYAFYPGHLLILGLLAKFVVG